MAEIRLAVDEEFIESLKEETGVKKATELTNEALMLLKWAVSEARNGRVLLSTDEQGKDPRRVVMPSLEKAKSIAKKQALNGTAKK